MAYSKIIRKINTGFSELFSNITLIRYNPDDTEQERFLVPIAHATKELYVMRLQADPDLDKKIQMTLPRLSFEMNGLTYDASRKQNTNIKNFAETDNGVISQYMQVPYNLDFSLYLYVRNIEDGTQIIEHILPYFTPDYTIKINLIPEMGMIKEVPIILNSTEYEINYEGDRDSDTRMIIWTLNFTAKAFLYRDASDTGLILKATTNIYNKDNEILMVSSSSTAAQVVDLLDESGNQILSEIDSTPIQSFVDVFDFPNLANSANSFSINTTITEY